MGCLRYKCPPMSGLYLDALTRKERGRGQNYLNLSFLILISRYFACPFRYLSALAEKEGAIDRRRRFIGSTLATPINPNKKPQGRGGREGAVSLEAGDQ
ncbi:MAG: hypothetical protein CRN43_14285 [Candidatus Nephrothrix sp. EaCA]|nr:MAG: hypothetical protein CRN43_14285 [Candidatus Nephrothrix sp. EaCA]